MKFSIVTILGLALSVTAAPLAAPEPGLEAPAAWAKGVHNKDNSRDNGNGQGAIGGLIGSLTGGFGVCTIAETLVRSRADQTFRTVPALGYSPPSHDTFEGHYN